MINKKWPNNWDYHISQYCSLYFYGKDITYLEKKLWTTEKINTNISSVSSMNLSFRIGEHEYQVGIYHTDGAHFSCSVYYQKSFEPGESPVDIYVLQAGTRYVEVLEEIAGIGGHDMTATCLIEFAEQTMIEDYSRRNGRGDDDNDDGENDPIFPLSPVEGILL